MDEGRSPIRTRVYRGGVLESEDVPLAEISTCVQQDDTVVWVDVCHPSADLLAELAGQLGLHDLAVEDALEPHQRPKVDHYASHLFVSCHAVRVLAEEGRLEKTEVDAFIGDRWLITVRSDDRYSMAPVLARWDQSTDIAAHGVSYLLYGLLDVIVDGYFEAVEVFDDYYDRVSEGIFADTPLEPSQQRHWFEMRRALVHFHRLVVPMREVVSGLMRREHSIVAEDLYPYYQDVYDHVLRVSETSESLRDLVSTIVETNLSLRDYRQNLVMKKVSSWAAIIAVPTLVTGYYGMNVPYPGFARHSGVLVSTMLIVLLSGGLYLSFRRRDWL
jgi:magnesium transporter